jgi:hypothetical protein
MKEKNGERNEKSGMKNEANVGHARIATGIALACSKQTCAAHQARALQRRFVHFGIA